MIFSLKNVYLKKCLLFNFLPFKNLYDLKKGLLLNYLYYSKSILFKIFHHQKCFLLQKMFRIQDFLPFKNVYDLKNVYYSKTFGI